jgi:pyruvate dehydrogenase E2 component (dihydrolipoamide acetyltransferase)
VAEPASVTRGAGEKWRASPLVKRLAAEHGLDLQSIAGSGPGGRIVKDDVMPYITGGKRAPLAQPAPAAPEPVATPVAAAITQTVPAAAPAQITGRPAGVARDMSKIRRTTGKRMTEAKQVIPHFYVTSEVNMEPAIAFREQVNAQITDDAAKVSFNDLIVKATALALREFPNLNTTLEGETLFDHANVDINMAVAIEGGLIAPFIPDADQKSIGTISRMAKDLIGRARNGGLQPSEYQGGTFTISNLGMYDVEEFVAIINPPQAAILAIGSITETPVVRDGQIVVGHQMKIALSADHRITDGAEVAKFLIAVKKYLQSPMLLAVG